jgi:hypothetical protein
MRVHDSGCFSFYSLPSLESFTSVPVQPISGLTTPQFGTGIEVNVYTSSVSPTLPSATRNYYASIRMMAAAAGQLFLSYHILSLISKVCSCPHQSITSTNLPFHRSRPPICFLPPIQTLPRVVIFERSFLSGKQVCNIKLANGVEIVG